MKLNFVVLGRLRMNIGGVVGSAFAFKGGRRRLESISRRPAGLGVSPALMDTWPYHLKRLNAV